ncbi:MAG: tetratricopeptide repeat protein [Phycisphaerales bacterium]
MSPAAVSASRFSGFSSLALISALLAASPSEAFAGGGGRHRDRCDDRPRYVDRHDHHGHSYHRGGYSSGLSISIGDCGSSLSYGALHGTHGVYRGRNWCDDRPRYVSPVYCPPRPVTYCPPTVVVAPAYCPPPQLVVHRPFVVERPVLVERPFVVERQVVVEQPVVVSAPQPVVVSAPVPPAAIVVQQASPQDRDLGTTYLRLGDLENAARLYQRYLGTYSTDPYAQRGMGLVELGRGNALEGTRWIAAAYRAERSLAVSPPSPDGVGGATVYQRMLDTAVLHAGQARTPESWLSVAILQHGLGQREVSLQSLQRARETGLDVTLLDAMTGAVAR